MLNGSAEYSCHMPLTWKPCVTCCQAPVAGPDGAFTLPLTTSRCRWSSSERPQSLERSNGSIGPLKKASPTSFRAFAYVYDTRTCPHDPGCWMSVRRNASYCELPAAEYWLLFA